MMENIAETAEKVMLALQELNIKTKQKEIKLKTNQIRKFLSAVNAIANKVAVYKAQHPGADVLSEELTMEIQYLQIKLVYQVGREKKELNPRFQPGPVEKFVQQAKLVERIKALGNSIKAFEEFNKYMEALVAYHKFYGGKD